MVKAPTNLERQNGSKSRFDSCRMHCLLKTETEEGKKVLIARSEVQSTSSLLVWRGILDIVVVFWKLLIESNTIVGQVQLVILGMIFWIIEKAIVLVSLRKENTKVESKIKVKLVTPPMSCVGRIACQALAEFWLIIFTYGSEKNPFLD